MGHGERGHVDLVRQVVVDHLDEAVEFGDHGDSLRTPLWAPPLARTRLSLSDAIGSPETPHASEVVAT